MPRASPDGPIFAINAAVSGDATNDGVGTTSVIGAVSFNSAAVIVRDANSTSND